MGVAVLDSTDIKLLQRLQVDARVSASELAHYVDLSPAGVHRRLKKLYGTGIIRQTVALVDRHKVGLDLLCFLSVTFKSNMHPGNRVKLVQAMAALPEVLECYTLTGPVDALIKVAVRDQEALKAFVQRLAEAQDVIDRVQTSLVLEEIKVTTSLALTLPDEG